LNTSRESGWDDLFEEAKQFWVTKSILVQGISLEIPMRGCSRHDGFNITNLHHYHAKIFCVVDKICAEMNH
jgi:hypothetical protein